MERKLKAPSRVEAASLLGHDPNQSIGSQFPQGKMD